MRCRPSIIASVGLVLFSAGVALGWWSRRPVQVVERVAPAKQLPSGALVVERNPDAATPPAIRVAEKESGGDLERAASITVKPTAIEVPPNGGPVCSCEPIKLDMGLLRFDDGHRLVVKAEGGEVIGGYDKPLQLEVQPVARKWAALVLVDPGAPRESFAAILERDAGPLRLAAAVVKVHEHVVPMVGAGWRW